MKRQTKETKPDAIDENTWKNRSRISCKLKHKTYSDLFIYCQKIILILILVLTTFCKPILN